MIGVKVDRAKRTFLDDGDISLEIGPFAISLFGLGLCGSGFALGLLLLLLAATLLAVVLALALLGVSGLGLVRALDEDLECDSDVATDQEEVLVQSQAVQGVEVPADGDPESAQKAVEGSMGERGDEGVGESAGEGLLRERSVRVVETYGGKLLVYWTCGYPIGNLTALTYRRRDPSKA